MSRPTVEERFWSKVDQRQPGCWAWSGATNLRGYGQFTVGRTNWAAHRLAYQLAIGPIPDGLTIDHLCHGLDCFGGDTCPHRRCVNPAHLGVVPGSVNVLRGTAPTAINARKTHCPKGHPYDEANTHFRREGWRVCRTCRRAEGGHSRRSPTDFPPAAALLGASGG